MPLAAIRAGLGEGGDVVYSAGYDPVHAGSDRALISDAVKTAKEADCAVVIVGLTGEQQSVSSE